MHKYKARASRLAWYPEEDGSRSFNPFGKFRPAPRPRDEELGRVVSESSAMNSAEQARKPPVENAGVPHSATMPSTAAKDANGDGIASSPTEPSSDSKDLAATPVDEKAGRNEAEMTTQANGEPHQRKWGFLAKARPKHGKDAAPSDAEKAKKPKKGHVNYSVGNQIRATILNSWINVLLIFVPIGIAVHFVKTIDPVIVFVLNFIAVIPLAAMLSYATEEIALHVGEVLGGLLNATFGNAVELIVSIIALFHNEILIVQTSLIGSMLSNLLLVLGMCFFLGGLNRVEQHFNVTVAQTASSLLALAIAGLIIPTAFNKWADRPGAEDDEELQSWVTQISRGTAIMLLVVYGCYLFFQLRTHMEMYSAPSEKATKRHERSKDKGEATKSLISMGAGFASVANNEDTHGKAKSGEREHEESEQPQLSLYVAIFTLCWSTALVGVCAEFLVDSIDALTKTTHISETFVGLILLPIIGNAAEHATSVTVACKDKMDLAIGVAVGSSMQIALLVLPLVVVIGWIAGKPAMNLDFNSFEIIILFVSVLLVNYLIGDGKSHWLEGVLLSMLYLIIALAAWYFPNEAPTEAGHTARR